MISAIDQGADLAHAKFALSRCRLSSRPRSILFIHLHGVTAALRYPSQRIAGWDQLPQVERRDLSAGQYDKQAEADKACHGRDGRMREADQFP